MENKDNLNGFMDKSPLSFRKASLFAFLFILFYTGTALILSNQPQNCNIFCYIMISVLYLLVTLSLFYATLHAQKYGKRTQIAWGMLTLSILVSTIGSAIWAVIFIYFNVNPSTSIADIFYLLFFPLFLIGILIFPSSRENYHQHFKVYFDIGIIIFSVILVLWSFVISPALSIYQGDVISLYFKIAYAIAGFMLLFALLDLLFRIKSEFQAPFLILLSAVLVLVITDSVYTYQTLIGTYQVGSPIDFGWIIGYLLIGLAGVSQFTDQRINVQKYLSKYIPWCVNYHWTPYLAFSGVLIAYILLIWGFNTYNPNLLFLEIGTGILILLVIFRQILSIKENKRLYLNAEKEIFIRKKAEKEIEKSLQEKEMLLKEIHHRVKNNLMVISSLLNLQSRNIKDEEHLEMFKETQSRAKSMAMIHERLYQSNDLKRIDFGGYIDSLAIDMFHTYVSDPGRVQLHINVEPALLDINTSIPLGLILNELLSNSMKYAFPDGKKGDIYIEFFKKEDLFTLIVKDNGVGFPEGLDYKNTDSLGLQLIDNLTKQINGNLKLDTSKGTCFKITFKEEFH